MPELRCVPLSALDGPTVYDLLALRSAVFVVEQVCVYLDPDGADRDALHVLAYAGGALVGAARVLPGPVPRIGRVVVAPAHRGTGLGRRLVAAALEAIGPGPSALSAQAHLEAFYASFGFRAAGPVHDEDGIPHVEMRRG